MKDERAMPVLPDLLTPGLRVVFCGTAAGNRSAAIGAYYAGRGNQFWRIVHQIGLTPRQLQPFEYRLLLDSGVGLTDLVKSRSGNDAVLRADDFDVPGFRKAILHHAPAALAFNGKSAARAFYGADVSYGRQSHGIGQIAVFVLPSTSGAARGFWDDSFWFELAAFVKRS
jgi:TDG/mug DNA glycosylase family protein